MSLTILDPTNEAVPVERQVTPRPETVKGKIAFLDISKNRGSVLLDRLQEAFEQRLPQIEITRYMKPTFSKPAPEDLRSDIIENNDSAPFDFKRNLRGLYCRVRDPMVQIITVERDVQSSYLNFPVHLQQNRFDSFRHSDSPRMDSHKREEPIRMHFRYLCSESTKLIGNIILS